MPSTGQMRERVRFAKRDRVKDGYGNRVSSAFTALFERSAQFIMKPGSEVALAARLEGKQPLTMIVRLDRQTREITPSWAVQDARTGVIYAIQAVADMDRRGQWLTLVCMGGEVP